MDVVVVIALLIILVVLVVVGIFIELVGASGLVVEDGFSF